MGSLRAGKVFDALSEGVGLFAEKSLRADEEKEKRAWDLTLANMRDRSAKESQKAGFEHSEQLARDNDAAAQKRFETQTAADTARFAAQTTATDKFRTTTMTASEAAEDKRRVDALRTENNRILVGFDKESRLAIKELGEFATDEDKAKIRAYYRGLKDEAIQSTIAYGTSQGLKGFQVDSERSLKGLLSNFGMDSRSAGEAAKQLFAQGTAMGPGESLGLDQNLVSRSRDASSQLNFLTDPALIDGAVKDGELFPTDQPMPDQAGAPQIQSPQVAPPQGSAGARREAAGSTKYGYNPNYDPFHGLFDNPRQPKEGEDPYAMMGQRRQ